jgi:hypothetical protein
MINQIERNVIQRNLLIKRIMAKKEQSIDVQKFNQSLDLFRNTIYEHEDMIQNQTKGGFKCNNSANVGIFLFLILRSLILLGAALWNIIKIVFEEYEIVQIYVEE